MTGIAINALGKQFGDQTAVSDLTFTADPGTFVVLLGPSGCGKSTTLRMIAGLEEPSGGSILIGGRDVTSLDPARRALSMVFQSYALFPHLSVADNILFGLKVRRVPRTERRRRLDRVVALVGLTDFLDRRPAQLSGGQRQRVALARAVIAEHAVCLMDEPLSNLDAKLRHEMRIELRALQQRLGMTVLYVTHDQTEAMSMADKVVLMNQGRLEQQGTPEDLYQRPTTLFAARFIGTPPMNLLPLRGVRGGAALAGDDGRRPVVADAGDGWTLGVRPEHLILSSEGAGLPVIVTSEDYHGADTMVGARLETGLQAEDIKVRMPGRARPGRGERLRLTWAPGDLHVFGPDGTRQDPMPRALPLPT